MILNTLKKIFKKYDDAYEFEMFIAKVNKNDELKAQAYANRSTYVNPCTLRIK